jgi:hypothetical protein
MRIFGPEGPKKGRFVRSRSEYIWGKIVTLLHMTLPLSTAKSHTVVNTHFQRYRCLRIVNGPRSESPDKCENFYFKKNGDDLNYRYSGTGNFFNFATGTGIPSNALIPSPVPNFVTLTVKI